MTSHAGQSPTATNRRQARRCHLSAMFGRCAALAGLAGLAWLAWLGALAMLAGSVGPAAQVESAAQAEPTDLAEPTTTEPATPAKPAATAIAQPDAAEQPAAEQPHDQQLAAERGLRALLTTAYLTTDFDQQVFDELWRCWEEPLRSQAASATPATRRQMAFARYGLNELPASLGGPQATAMQYVDDGQGGWAMNCFSCHTGKVAGVVVPGLGNSLYDLQTLTEEVRLTKLRLGKALTHLDRASLLYPLGGSIGTTNAVMFGKILLAHRDEELQILPQRRPIHLEHHDHDAPAWWLLKRKRYLYIDGFVPKSHRSLMQFLLIPRNGPEMFRAWENDYRDILAWIESLEAPRYPGPVDSALARQGQLAFHRVCAECHGTYGPAGHYPERTVPLATIGTDPIRLRALAVEGRAAYAKSWFAAADTEPVIVEPTGYVAPPLDGVWATAPYLHNGSVPTLWHLLHPDERPMLWRRTADGYDHQRVGLEFTAYDELPAEAKADPRLRRHYFDSRRTGKSAAGHDFGNRLTPAERRAVLEYLKTL